MSYPIQGEGLTKRYRRVAAVENLTLKVREGSIYALVGPNGAGKTTLIKLLMNLLRPTSGRATVLDADSRRLAPAHLAQIGYVSENQELPDWMTVSYLLHYLKPFYPTWDDPLAAQLVREFQLPTDRKLKHLSRGMKMKAALASSLAYHPRLILLDEPFSGLDPLVRDEFIQGLIERATEATVFVSSHDLAEIESFSSHIGFLDSGRMQFSEEITPLMERFREIEVTLPAPSLAPSNWPDHWLQPQTSSAVIRFVETQVDELTTRTSISRLFPGAAQISITPMTLREIFVATAKDRRRIAA